MNRSEKAQVWVGFAADGPRGVAYASIRSGSKKEVARIPFACRPLPALRGRDIAYVALETVAARLLAQGVRSAAFTLAAPELVADLDGRRTVPQALAIRYVTLRCRLNQFALAHVRSAEEDPRCKHLSARAQAEIARDLAA